VDQAVLTIKLGKLIEGSSISKEIMRGRRLCKKRAEIKKGQLRPHLKIEEGEDQDTCPLQAEILLDLRATAQ
jgi:hypothetical protein